MARERLHHTRKTCCSVYRSACQEVRSAGSKRSELPLACASTQMPFSHKTSNESPYAIPAYVIWHEGARKPQLLAGHSTLSRRRSAARSTLKCADRVAVWLAKTLLRMLGHEKPNHLQSTHAGAYGGVVEDSGGIASP